MPDIVKDKVAVVTGSGMGIGRGEAIGLAAQGAKVVVNARTREAVDKVVKEIRKSGGVAVANYDSVASIEGADRIVRTAIDNFGRIDILVNNAGGPQQMGPVFDINPEIWDEVVKVNLSGTFYCTHYAVKQMKQQGYGRIINTSSHNGLGEVGNCDYSAAKEGVVGFTRSVARELAEYGITCNAIRPCANTGQMDNPVAQQMLKNALGEGAMEFVHLLQEYYTPEGVAPLVVYLASEYADNVNGCLFEVYTGHVALYPDPQKVEQVLWKNGYWSPEELVDIMPKTLAQGKVRRLPPVLPGPLGDYIRGKGQT